MSHPSMLNRLTAQSLSRTERVGSIMALRDAVLAHPASALVDYPEPIPGEPGVITMFREVVPVHDGGAVKFAIRRSDSAIVTVEMRPTFRVVSEVDLDSAGEATLAQIERLLSDLHSELGAKQAVAPTPSRHSAPERPGRSHGR